ncbi:hypothetical protein IH779_00225 [Patescibacteria group bacterium]|nr:hypothetical protein [Patescibacteria group bacterium]
MVKILLDREEAVSRYHQLISIRLPVIGVFLFATLILRVIFGVQLPDIYFILVSFLAISTLVYDIIFKQIKDPKISHIVNGYFGYLLFDVTIMTMIIYTIGGITWIGFVFYALYIYVSFSFFPRTYSVFFVFYCSFIYTLLVIVQYLGIFPYQTIFSAEERVVQNFSYVFPTWVTSIIFLWVLAYYSDSLYRFLQGKIEELQKTEIILEEERASLEIRVRARTSELWEEREGLEAKIQERTKDLEKERKELARKLAELEKFHKAAVGRELKMKELKKEITSIQKELKAKN